MQADELERTQARIDELRAELYRLESRVGEDAAVKHPARQEPGMVGARAMLAGRAALTRYFDPNLFADPAMDILLYLFAEGEEGRAATTSACCAATLAPRTTALRWIKLLMTQGLIVSENDPGDGRVTLLRLADPARANIDAWLHEVSTVSPTR